GCPTRPPTVLAHRMPRARQRGRSRGLPPVASSDSRLAGRENAVRIERVLDRAVHSDIYVAVGVRERRHVVDARAAESVAIMEECSCELPKGRPRALQRLRIAMIEDECDQVVQVPSVHGRGGKVVEAMASEDAA